MWQLLCISTILSLCLPLFSNQCTSDGSLWVNSLTFQCSINSEGSYNIVHHAIKSTLRHWTWRCVCIG